MIKHNLKFYSFLIFSILIFFTQFVYANKNESQTGKLTLRSNLYNDKVTINGESKGSTRLDLTLKAGEYKIKIGKKGYETWERTLTIKAGSHQVVRAKLKKMTEKMTEKVTKKEPSKPIKKPEKVVAVKPIKKPVKDVAVKPVKKPVKVATPQPLNIPKETTDSKPVSNQKKQAMSTTKNSNSIQDNETGLLLLKVPSGCFQMGSNSGDQYSHNEKPEHKVCLKQDFYISKYEVTQAQWTNVMGNNPSRFPTNGEHPVEQVSWDDVQKFIKKLNEKTGQNYRLPSEAEWEYACRSGGKKQQYCGGDDVSLFSWNNEDWKSGHHPVGQKSANEFGLHDMSGNVWEWVQDWHAEDYYQTSPSNNPTGPSEGIYRSFRGGSWGNGDNLVRSTYRNEDKPDSRFRYLGFRLAKDF